MIQASDKMVYSIRQSIPIGKSYPNQTEVRIIKDFLISKAKYIRLDTIDEEARVCRSTTRMILYGLRKSLEPDALKRISNVLEKIFGIVITKDTTINSANVTFEMIQDTITEKANIPITKLKMKHPGSRDIILERQIGMYLAKKYIKTYPPLSFRKIGDEFGGFDHATVMFAINSVSGLIEVDRTIKAKVEGYERIINEKIIEKSKNDDKQRNIT
jgi:hypothetical protein